MNRAGKISIVGVVLSAVGAYGLLFGAVVFKTYWANLEVKEAVQRTAYEWRDISKTAAERYLNRELTRLDFDLASMCDQNGDYGCCTLYKEIGERHVSCWWWDSYKWPLLDRYTDISYEAHKIILDSNQVVDGDWQ